MKEGQKFILTAIGFSTICLILAFVASRIPMDATESTIEDETVITIQNNNGDENLNGSIALKTSTPSNNSSIASAQPEQAITVTIAPTPTTVPTPVALFTVSTNANLRAGPGTEYDIVGLAESGETLDVFARTADGWLQIDAFGKLWIGSSLGELDQSLSSIPIAGDQIENLSGTPSISITPSINVYDYEIEDISFGNVRRFSLYVTAPFPISTEEIKTICEGVVENFKQQQNFNAVTVFVSDTALPAFGFTLASCTFAPNGEWADADTVSAGDYSNHSFSYIFQPKVEDSNSALSERPTAEEFTICSEWAETDQELIDSGVDAIDSEDLAYEAIADKYGTSSENIQGIILKCVFWTSR